MAGLSGIVATALALPIVSILGVLALIGFALYLRHRERMQGFLPAPPPHFGGPPDAPRTRGEE